MGKDKEKKILHPYGQVINSVFCFIHLEKVK